MTDSKDFYQYLFGPVPSRRLGFSLGVDLVPGNVCTLDCVYCECGKTRIQTCKRAEYAPTEEVCEELERMLSKQPSIDYITFSGSGEPTLHNRIGDIIRSVKMKFPNYPIAVLSNGTLMDREDVRDELMPADVLKVSLDAAGDAVFRKINRPASGLNLKRIREALVTMRRRFPGTYWVEVFIVPGGNDTPEELDRIRELLQRIEPDMIQLNALDRPGTESWVQGITEERKQLVAKQLGASDVIRYPARPVRTPVDFFDFEHRILDAVRRRPYTCQDIARVLGTPEDDIQMKLDNLVRSGVLKTTPMPRGVFYLVNDR